MTSQPTHCFYDHRRFFSISTILIVVALLSTLAPPCHADDIGLATVKLTEQAENRYLLETDVPPQFQNLLGVPVLPEGFQTQAAEFERRGALINVRYPFTGEIPLGPEDTIHLPWSRTGALVNARWLDGSRGSHLFSGTIEGIKIEIAQVKTVRKSRGEAIGDGFLLGFRTVSRNWMLWIPVLCIGLLFPRAQATCFLAMLMAGLTAALVILDIYAVTIPASIALSIMMVAVVLAVRLPEARLAPMFAAAACVLGLAGAASLPTEPRIAFIFGAVLFFAGAGAVLVVLRRFLPPKLALQPAALLIGGFAVAAVLITLLNLPPAAEAESMPPAPLPAAAKSTAAKAPSSLEDPFMVFVTIEPYEVRFEIMASGDAITQVLEFPLADPQTIQIDEQKALKEKAIADFVGRFSLEIDDKVVSAEVQRADFLTLGAAGAYTRTEAVAEPLESAILGLTFAYPLTTTPGSLALNWKQLPMADTELPATVLEPSGITGFSFSSDQLTLEWQNESDELRPSVITAVDVARPTWVPVSILLLLAGLVLTARAKNVAGYACLAVALLATPLVRSTLPFVSALPEEQASEVVEHLLTNIYRSFDYRQESAIYDQLAIGVTGDQLNEIYLGQRRALELENRGGARARVENVEVEAIESVKPDGEGAHVHARWNVSGSVNHFGHTHYRQNAYDAILHLQPIDGIWKISAIEVNEEKRVY